MLGKRIIKDPKVSTMWTQLTWSHLRLLFNLEIESVNYYIQNFIDKHLSIRELEHEYEGNIKSD